MVRGLLQWSVELGQVDGQNLPPFIPRGGSDGLSVPALVPRLVPVGGVQGSVASGGAISGVARSGGDSSGVVPPTFTTTVTLTLQPSNVPMMQKNDQPKPLLRFKKMVFGVWPLLRHRNIPII
ncbi:hypothetical protein LIER_39557 [Lithospermum erythrorhizon]|uniref:Uncharacterized protein n=1 Tax=Lithospermum erythrorhizon TaxID=34254 RepID=A0AAV3QHM2_LITER